MRQMLETPNVGLSTTRSVEIGDWEHIFCTATMIQHHTVSLKEVNYLFPLYLYPTDEATTDLFDAAPAAGRRANLAPEFIADFSSRLGMQWVPDGTGDRAATFGPEDVFHYLYAVFHSPAYRQRYAEFLRIDFPRLPLTRDAELFRALCEPGRELVALHLMEAHPPLITRYTVPGDNAVDRVRYTEPGQGGDEGRVWINATQFFDGVPPEVWSFRVGGYQVAGKWLKDRRGRQLTFDDLTHYQRVLAALARTGVLMQEVDAIVDRHGGWPLAGSAEGE
jgi:predicted helicase